MIISAIVAVVGCIGTAIMLPAAVGDSMQMLLDYREEEGALKEVGSWTVEDGDVVSMDRLGYIRVTQSPDEKVHLLLRSTPARPLALDEAQQTEGSLRFCILLHPITDADLKSILLEPFSGGKYEVELQIPPNVKLDTRYANFSIDQSVKFLNRREWELGLNANASDYENGISDYGIISEIYCNRMPDLEHYLDTEITEQFWDGTIYDVKTFEKDLSTQVAWKFEEYYDAVAEILTYLSDNRAIYLQYGLIVPEEFEGTKEYVKLDLQSRFHAFYTESCLYFSNLIEERITTEFGDWKPSDDQTEDAYYDEKQYQAYCIQLAEWQQKASEISLFAEDFAVQRDAKKTELEASGNYFDFSQLG